MNWYKIASILQKIAAWMNKRGYDKRIAALLRKRLEDRLVYSRYDRCPCGAGLAYDPAGTRHWDCSAIFLEKADQNVMHTDRLPFAFYNIKEERQGISTRQ